MKKKAIALLLASAMVVSMAACGGKDNDVDSKATPAPSTTTPAPSTATAAPGNTDPTSAPEVADKWDGAYMDADDYKAYIAHDLEVLVTDMQDQLTADQKTKVEAAKKTGVDAVNKAETIAAVQKAYSDAYNAILACVPLANGLYSFSDKDYDERANMLGILESYALRKGLTGISLNESGAPTMYNPRITLGTENYIVGYGFGTLAEGAITADLEYESNPAWKRYYHSLSASDPGTLNYLNDKGSEVGDFYAYIAQTYFDTFMNETKDGYVWTPVLAMEMPVALNDDDGNGTASKWRFQVRTGAEGLKYTTGSTMASRAAFNNREVALEDYETPFKLLLTQSNQLVRGSEMANNNTGAIVGAKAFYDGTANGFSQDLWDKVGIKTYVEGGKSYFEVEYTQELNSFYAMYYINSTLYQPIPQDFLDLVTVQNYLGFNNNATETPVDNSLALSSYYLETYNQDQEIVYKKNPNYVFAGTKYSIEGLHFRIFPAMKEDNEASFNEFIAGHTDAASIPYTRLSEYVNDPRTRKVRGTSVFKLNVNALDAETWEQFFGEEGSVEQTAKADYWEVEPALNNVHFILGLQYSVDRLAFANSRGYNPTVDFLAPSYMANPQDRISYSETAAHKKAIAPLVEGTDGYGYSLELAREYFRVALAELEEAGAYKPGTAANPTEIKLEVAWMYASDEERFHNELKTYWETAFNDPTVSDGKYKLNVEFWVGNSWSDVYYNKMLVGQYDIGYGSISGNSLNPLDFVGVLSSDPVLAGGFTLNWGADTNDPAEYPIVYEGNRYSYDAFYLAANDRAVVVNGRSEDAVSYVYEKIKKNDDGSYTGAFELTAALPDITTVTPTSVVCVNDERYFNGDGTNEQKEVTFQVENKGKGVVRVTFTVPADLAASYATGSGTSATPKGIVGFEVYYDYEMNGVKSAGNYETVEDAFAVN